jgi:uncharacterized protein (DUF2062 family)
VGIDAGIDPCDDCPSQRRSRHGGAPDISRNDSKKLFARWLPDPGLLHRNRWLRWLGPALLHRRLWHYSRRGVAAGVAIGVFFGFLVPIAQIPIATGVAALVRANVPTAIAGTLVTNPVTFAPVYLLAHRLGSALLDADEMPPTLLRSDVKAEGTGGWVGFRERVVGLGRPLILGLAVLAVTAGLLAYVGIMVGWRMRTAWMWRRRRGRPPS